MASFAQPQFCYMFLPGPIATGVAKLSRMSHRNERSLTSSTLSQEQVNQFRMLGYLRLFDVIEPDLAFDLRIFIESEFEHNDGTLARNGGQVKLYDFYQRSGGLGDRLIRNERLLNPLRSLLGPHVVLQLNRHNQASLNRPGKCEARLHRDVLQWSRNLVTVVVYLEDSSIVNGCTYLVPGSQFAPFVGVPQEDGGGTWMSEHSEFDGQREQALPVPVPSCGVLLLDSLVFHSVGVNRSNRDRPSVVLGFRSVDELDPRPLDASQLLVCGEDIYRGNDANRRVESDA